MLHVLPYYIDGCKIYTCTSIRLFYVLPDNSSNASCPSQPCATLSRYLLNTSVLSNVKLLFLSGKHSLTSEVKMQHAYNVTMVGIDYDSLAPVIIFCYSAKAVVVFVNSSNITIANLMFKNCGGIGPTAMPGYDPVHPNDHSALAATIFFDICYHCTIMNVTFIGYGLMANNLLGESHLDNITLHLQTTHYSLPQWCNQGIKLINNRWSSHYISNSTIFVNKITINGSGNNCQTTYKYDVGMRIDLEPIDYNITLMLSNSDFYNVNVQPILLIGLLHGVSSKVMLWVKNCKFQYNNYTSFTSELRPPVQIFVSCINMTLYFTNCFFYRNKNTKELSLISIEVFNYDSGFMSYQGKFDEPYILPSDWCLFPSYIRIKDSNFIGNIGTLIDIQSKKISGCIARFSIIGIFKLLRNSGNGIDIITIRHITVNIIGEAHFSYNSNARNIISFYSCTVIFRKNITFVQNWYSVDQIITLHSDLAYIKIVENTHIKFINNTYSNQAVQVKVQNYMPHPFCVFQYGTITLKNASHALLKSYSISFRGRYKLPRYFAYDDDNSVRLLMNYYTFHCQWLPKAVFHGYHPADINKQIIQTNDEQMYQHTRVCYCHVNNTDDCSIDLLGPIFPGQVLQVNLCISHVDDHESDNDELFVLYVDTHNAFLPADSTCKVANQNEIINTISTFSKTYNFTIVSESENECELFLTAQPDLYKRYDAFYVQLLPCPIGFTLQNGVCDCDPVLSAIISRCYIDYSAIRRPANIWIVAYTQTSTKKYLISNCPKDYCLPYPTNINLLHPDLQCQFNRTDILCSQCQYPLSMVFASSRCIKCTNLHILIAIIVIVAGIILVVLLYVLNLTVTNGSINGIIFYANIISINDSVFLLNDNVFKPLRVFISFANLDLGIETCFYNGMDSYAKVWLQLFFPSYLIIIAISIIIASRYSTRILRLTYTRSLPVLATLFLLSYTGVLRTVLTVLFSYSTITCLPSGHQQIVWSIDASVPLFGLKFTILFITCLALFLLLIPFNITLLFTRYFLRFRIVSRFKPLWDAFQGSYKDKYYYWIAVHLALRSLFFTFYVFQTKLKLIISTMLLIIFSIYSGYVQPNKTKLVNIQEHLLLINLTIMYAAVSYEGSIFFIVTNVVISLAFVQFGIIVLYHFLTYTCHCDVTHMLKTTKQKLMMKLSNKNLNNNSNAVIALLNIPERTYNYTEYRDSLVSDDFNI